MERYTIIPNGGLNQSGALTDAAQHECVDGANIIVTPGGFKPRAGRVIASRMPENTITGGALCLAEYVNPDYPGSDTEVAALMYVGQFDNPSDANGALYYTLRPDMNFAYGPVATIPTMYKVTTGSVTIPAAVKVRMAQVGDSMLICTRGATSPILRLFGFAATDKSVAWPLADEVRPTTPPTPQSIGATGPSYIPEGVYSFKSSYGKVAYGETSEGETGPTLTISIAAGVSTLVRRQALDNTVVAGDVVYLYATGGDSAEWLRVASETLDATDITNTYVDFTLNGTTTGTIYPATIVPLTTYLSRPPAGCDGVASYRNRALYWKGDLLYISNDGDATRMPLLPYDDTDATYGGWVRIGEDGGAITGVGIQDGYALVFKANATYLLSGEPGLPQFGLRQISGSVGCLSHESIAACENILVWCGTSGVWAFDGQQVQEIGKNINPTIKGYGTVRMGSSFSIYIPTTRWYRLHIRGTADVFPNGDENIHHAFVFDFAQGQWFPVFTGQPSGCALYAAYATTPGVYASNAAGGITGLGIIYLLDSGAQDVTRAETPTAITWSRVSREEIHDPIFLVQVNEVTVWGHGTLENTADNLSLTLTLYQDEEATIADANFAKTVTWNAQRSTRGSASTRFPQNRNTSHRIGLSGVHSGASVAAQEIRRVQVSWSPRGRNSR
jgi:hypothetical protein